jgi:hypothetical protein
MALFHMSLLRAPRDSRRDRQQHEREALAYLFRCRSQLMT